MGCFGGCLGWFFGGILILLASIFTFGIVPLVIVVYYLLSTMGPSPESRDERRKKK